MFNNGTAPTVSATTFVLMFSATAFGQEINVGPIEVGVTDCEEAFYLAKADDAYVTGYTNSTTKSVGVEMGHGAFGLPFALSLTFVCDPYNETVHSVHVVIDRSDAVVIADALNAKYAERERRLPQLGSGTAIYDSGSGWTMATVYYSRLSFDARVMVNTQAWDEMIEAIIEKEDREAEEALRDAF